MGVLGRVAVLGSGVIGTSIALALRRRGVQVDLSDREPAAVAAAVRRGAGRPRTYETPPADVVVVATPPSAVAGVLREAQQARLGSVYTDVASVKVQVIAGARLAGCDLSCYVPAHPMGGRELSGPEHADPGLFAARTWVLCPQEVTAPAALRAVERLAELSGAVPLRVPAEEHDRAVAAVSHAPHLISSALAAHMGGVDQVTLALAGRGLTDMTRIAAGSPELWRDILQHNAGPVATVLETIASDLVRAAAALRGSDPAARHALTDLLVRGVVGRSRTTGPRRHVPEAAAVA